MSAGIDYGMGQTNIDTKTGIRYGVISLHSLASWIYDELENDYGPATCGECGNEACAADQISTYFETEPEWFEGKDYFCLTCERSFWSDDAFGDEPIGFHLEDHEYTLIDCLDVNAMITRSPFYTFAPFCSPCVPGAGDLDNAHDSGAKTYCLNHEWFEDGKAPYRVYRVDDNTEVFPKENN